MNLKKLQKDKSDDDILVSSIDFVDVLLHHGQQLQKYKHGWLFYVVKPFIGMKFHKDIEMVIDSCSGIEDLLYKFHRFRQCMEMHRVDSKWATNAIAAFYNANCKANANSDIIDSFDFSSYRSSSLSTSEKENALVIMCSFFSKKDNFSIYIEYIIQNREKPGTTLKISISDKQDKRNRHIFTQSEVVLYKDEILYMLELAIYERIINYYEDFFIHNIL